MKATARLPRCPKGQWRNRITGLCESHKKLNLEGKPIFTKGEMDAANILLSLRSGPVVSSRNAKKTRSNQHTNSSSPGKKTKKARNYKNGVVQQQPSITQAGVKGVQGHGKIWEHEFIPYIVAPEYVHEALNLPHTARHDIKKEHNILPGKRNISVKSTNRHAVDFGDALRTIENVEKASPLEAIIVKYKQVGDIKEPTGLIRIDLNRPDIYLGQDFEAVREDIKTIDQMVKADRPQSDYKDIVARVQKNMRENGAELTIAPKRGNPKKKRAGRLQITMPNIGKFVIRHPDLVISSDELLNYENLSRVKSAKRKIKRDTNS